MTLVDTPKMLHQIWKTVLAWGVLTLILGVVVLIWPGKSILVAAVVFGVYLLASGIAQIVFALLLSASGGQRVLLFISGALSIVLGVVAFRHYEEGWPVLLLAIWIGVGFIFQGVAAAGLAASHPQLPGRGWHIFLGALSIIAGIVVMAWPFGSIVMLAIVTGIWLIVIGITQVIWAISARKEIGSVETALTN